MAKRKFYPPPWPRDQILEHLPCAGCGHDLYRMPRGGRCPVCGTPVNQTQIQQHIHCVNCGYDLYQGDRRGRCPECGTYVDVALERTARDREPIRPIPFIFDTFTDPLPRSRPLPDNLTRLAGASTLFLILLCVAGCGLSCIAGVAAGLFGD